MADIDTPTCVLSNRPTMGESRDITGLDHNYFGVSMVKDDQSLREDCGMEIKQDSTIERHRELREKFWETEEWKHKGKTEVNDLHAENNAFETLGWDYEEYSDKPVPLPDSEESLSTCISKMNEILNKYKESDSSGSNSHRRTRTLFSDEPMELHSDPEVKFPKPVSLDNVTDVFMNTISSARDSIHQRRVIKEVKKMDLVSGKRQSYERHVIGEMEKTDPVQKDRSAGKKNYDPKVIEDLKKMLGLDKVVDYCERDTRLEELFKFKKIAEEECTEDLFFYPLRERKPLYQYKHHGEESEADNLEIQDRPIYGHLYPSIIPETTQQKVVRLKLTFEIDPNASIRDRNTVDESLKDMCKKDRKAARKARQTRNPEPYQRK